MTTTTTIKHHRLRCAASVGSEIGTTMGTTKRTSRGSPRTTRILCCGTANRCWTIFRGVRIITTIDKDSNGGNDDDDDERDNLLRRRGFAISFSPDEEDGIIPTTILLTTTVTTNRPGCGSPRFRRNGPRAVRTRDRCGGVATTAATTTNVAMRTTMTKKPHYCSSDNNRRGIATAVTRTTIAIETPSTIGAATK